jgi:hypothetical protein
MYLDGGVWNGRRIVPSKWVDLSTAPKVEVSPQMTGLSEDEFSNFYLRAEDGLAWHLNTLKSGGRGYRTYGATGNGGPLLMLFPMLTSRLFSRAEIMVRAEFGFAGHNRLWATKSFLQPCKYGDPVPAGGDWQ